MKLLCWLAEKLPGLSKLHKWKVFFDIETYGNFNGKIVCQRCGKTMNVQWTMTAEEREAQRRSFAYGNARMSNPRITKEMIDAAAEHLKNED